ncbi:hypothetical protein SNOG_09578 [Parastagonospora nodorum SN15]|uniref:Uncharacterized protein n=1 Tax=Phaeosphaeria nodorum (strain SN15 / ATCC MYA-4574 / FGSC 10173) TaxID=321614 RepID=Q0UF86_PHANO|nr:hypothetical protein SNOG_09578 [Parastagonospora nodorum SN15]EAT82843.1 hypothetical protein SNOG_09578 [Parastagonospora nodorum SN15]
MTMSTNMPKCSEHRQRPQLSHPPPLCITTLLSPLFKTSTLDPSNPQVTSQSPTSHPLHPQVHAPHHYPLTITTTPTPSMAYSTSYILSPTQTSPACTSCLREFKKNAKRPCREVGFTSFPSLLEEYGEGGEGEGEQEEGVGLGGWKWIVGVVWRGSGSGSGSESSKSETIGSGSEDIGRWFSA